MVDQSKPIYVQRDLPGCGGFANWQCWLEWDAEQQDLRLRRQSSYDHRYFDEIRVEHARMNGYICGMTWGSGRGRERCIEEHETEILLCLTCLKRHGFMW